MHWQNLHLILKVTKKETKGMSENRNDTGHKCPIDFLIYPTSIGTCVLKIELEENWNK